MSLKLLDTVVLVRDIPEKALKSGDIGVIVEIYNAESSEVEFVTAAGKTKALLTLSSKDYRAIDDSDILAVRSLNAA